MSEISYLISWKMERFSPYTPAHLLVVLAAAAFAVLFCIAFRKVSSQRLYPAVGIFLLVTEIVKQFFLTYVRGSYSWSDMPFQLCSIPMYLCIIYGFFPRKWIEDFLMIFALTGAVAALVEPTSSFSSYVFLTVHSVLWHAILLALGLRQILIFIKGGSGSCKDYRYPALAYLIFALTAILINSVFYRVSDGTSNMFFLGPGRPDIIILDRIYESFGWVVSSAVMILTTECFGFVLYCLLCLINNRNSFSKSA